MGMVRCKAPSAAEKLDSESRPRPSRLGDAGLLSTPRGTSMTTTREHGAARTVVAVFTDRADARDAVRELQDAGYKDYWIGTTRPHGPTDDSRGTPPGTLTGTMDGTDVVEGDSGDILGKIGRFFAGADYTLGEALCEHGVTNADAARLE